MKVDFNPSYISYKANPLKQNPKTAVKAIEKLPCYNELFIMKELGNNSYFGFRKNYWFGAYNSSYCKPDFEKAGIKHVISIINDINMESAVKKDGFDYLFLPFDSNSSQQFRYSGENLAWMQPPFTDKYGWEHTRPDAKHHNSESYETLSRNFIDKFTKFISCLQDGNCYIEGAREFDTEGVFILNKFFNPKADQVEPPLELPHLVPEHTTAHMINLYKALTKEDKASMGWPKNFDTTFLQNIKKNEYDRINSEVALYFHQLEEE